MVIFVFANELLILALRLYLLPFPFYTVHNKRCSNTFMCANTFTSCIFYLPFLLSFVFPFCQIFSRTPIPSFLTHSPSRGQYSVAHLYRCQLQHSHQWYVSIKLSAPLLSLASEWTPVHSAVK